MFNQLGTASLGCFRIYRETLSRFSCAASNGFIGNIKFQNVKSTGKFTALNNWQISFSDIEGKPKTYNVQFACIKGARVLWIGDTGFGKKP
ncbi:hypothetical protein [Pedobacter steynii]